jgi:hypothetical protein
MFFLVLISHVFYVLHLFLTYLLILPRIYNLSTPTVSYKAFLHGHEGIREMFRRMQLHFPKYCLLAKTLDEYNYILNSY